MTFKLFKFEFLLLDEALEFISLLLLFLELTLGLMRSDPNLLLLLLELPLQRLPILNNPLVLFALHLHLKLHGHNLFLILAPCCILQIIQLHLKFLDMR